MNSLENIRVTIANHSTNKEYASLGYQPVYSAGENSRVVIVGQAPGRKAQESGIPWNDASGDRLRMWLAVDREQFYDTSLFALIPMDFYYPGKGVHGDLPPRAGFAQKWHPLILQQMPHVELMILVGRYAQKYYLASEAKRTLTETVQSYTDYSPRLWPIVHPSPLNTRWLRLHPWFEDSIVPDLRKRIAAIISDAG